MKPLLAGRPLGLHVLVVDDGPQNIALARALLGRLGCTVDSARTGAEALRALGQRRPYDVVMMDFHLGDMNGHTVTLQLREIERAADRSPVPVVVVSGDDDACTAGATAWHDAFLTKPFTAEQLANVLRGVTSPLEQANTSAIYSVPPEAARAARERSDHVLAHTIELVGSMRIALGRGDFDAVVAAAREVGAKGDVFAASTLRELGEHIEISAGRRSRDQILELLLQLDLVLEIACLA